MPRYIKKQTIDEFKIVIEELGRKNGFDIKGEYADSSIEEILLGLISGPDDYSGMSGIRKDLYQDGGFENGDFPSEAELTSREWYSYPYDYHKILLVGFHSLEGRTFYGGFISQDWTDPSFVALYLDDKGVLRAYVPKKGNGMNPLNKKSFGYDEDADDKYACSKGFKTFYELREGNPEYLLDLYDNALVKQELLKRLAIK